MVLTAQDLVNKVCLYVSIYSNRVSGNAFYANRIKDVPSCYFRLLEIESLLQAFRLNKAAMKAEIPEKYARYYKRNGDNQSEIEFFMDGHFLQSDRFVSAANEKVMAFLQEHLNAESLKRDIERELVVLRPQKMFYALIRLKIDIDNILKPKYINLEGVDYNLRFVEHFKFAHIIPCKEQFDRFLTDMIAPDGLSFSKEELIKNYAYPDVDLGRLDTDWVIEKYSDW